MQDSAVRVESLSTDPDFMLIESEVCGNTFSGGGGPAPDGFSGCNMPCSGNSSEFCGGPNRLDLYQAPGTGAQPIGGSSSSSSTKPPSATATLASSTKVPSSTASSTKSSSSVASPTSGAGNLPAGWTYKGCYIDNANGRVLPVQQPDSTTQTVESCISACSQLGYSVSGTEYGSQCFCGNAIYSGGALAPSDTDCNMACSGNAAEKCGAGNRLSIYSNSTLTTYQPAAVQKTGLPGSWTYDGCYK